MQAPGPPGLHSTPIVLRPLQGADLSETDRVFRLAFGTYLGLPDPLQFETSRSYAFARWRADPDGAVVAEVGGALVGASFLARRGSVATLGPIMVRPDFWDRGVAKRLMGAMVELFPKWGTTHAGLFTFAQSAKHVGLYQKFGFWPRFLTAIMAKPVNAASRATGWQRFSETVTNERARVLQAARELTGSIHEGLDLEREIRVVDAHQLGDTVLLWENTRLVGFGVCHCGASTEAGEGNCYIKFGAVRRGAEAAGNFERLLHACETLAVTKGLVRMEAGVNTARHEAYRQMLARGFRTQIQGVTMHRPNEPAHHGPEVYLIEDWR